MWTQPEISSSAIQSWLLRHRLHLGICQTLEPCWFSHFTLGKKGNILKTFNHRCSFKLPPAGARQPSLLQQPYPESKIVPPLFLSFQTNVSVFSSSLDKFPELWPPPTPRCEHSSAWLWEGSAGQKVLCWKSWLSRGKNSVTEREREGGCNKYTVKKLSKIMDAVFDALEAIRLGLF